ncbi:MAG: alanine--tRNA ligase, partial [Verrucomicrobiae bacterium]|nr:alanine--tRNA ligase [Verrucomicrobiae bacterium]
IQFNANADGTFTPLPAKHVDTGAGFERVSAIIQCTKNFTDFSGIISNYETDIFRPLFDRLEQLSGKRYGSTLPAGQSEISNPQSQIALDVAFRVIADHIRCLSFGIADGILPGNEGRGYVLRRILRRAVRYGRFLGFHEPFFYKLVDVLARTMGDVFPEVRRRQTMIEKILRAEEENFNRTLDRGIELLDQAIAECQGGVLDAVTAFKLYDTYGFPLDLTELMCREQGLKVDVTGFERLMEQQRERARQDHERKKTAITVADEGLQIEPTKFIGYDHLEAEALVEAIAPGAQASSLEIILDRTPFYAEMGGQVGDTGLLHVPGHDWSELGRLEVTDTQRHGELHVHRARLVSGRAPEVGEGVRVAVDAARRANIQRHHTATHLFHWALHEVVSREARQRGSLAAPDRMRFDFNHHEHLTPQQIADIERLVNERIRENAPVYGFEVPYRDIKGNPKVMQFFGEKYGDVVRVIQIGGHPGRFDGFALELCGGTHTRNTGDIGAFKIARESAIAAGVRRVEAAAGQFALELIEKLQAHEQKEAELAKARELEKEQAKERQARMQREAPAIAAQLVAKAAQAGGIRVVTGNLGDANTELLRLVVDALKPVLPSGIAVLGGVSEGKVCLIGYVTPDLVKQGKHAGKIVGAIAKLCGGGGGGRPDLAQAGGKAPARLEEALRAVAGLVG